MVLALTHSSNIPCDQRRQLAACSAHENRKSSRRAPIKQQMRGVTRLEAGQGTGNKSPHCLIEREQKSLTVGQPWLGKAAMVLVCAGTAGVAPWLEFEARNGSEYRTAVRHVAMTRRRCGFQEIRKLTSPSPRDHPANGFDHQVGWGQMARVKDGQGRAGHSTDSSMGTTVRHSSRD